MKRRSSKSSEPGDGPGSVLPAAFLERQRVLLGSSLVAWRSSLAEAWPVAFRVNTLTARVAEVRAELTEAGLHPAPMDFRADAFTVPAAERAALVRSRAASEARVYVQTPSSMVPPMVLAPRPGEEVLDMAAAPGGKTLVMAAAMGNRGRIAAVERSRARFFRLQAVCRRHGAAIVHAYLQDGTALWRKTPERFDRVLLDAPCSGEARIRPDDPASFHGWGGKRRRRLSALQARLLASAVGCLRPGGVLVYSTCTFAPEENEAVVAATLERFDGALELEPVDVAGVPLEPGAVHWDGGRYAGVADRVARIPPRPPWEGFFIARLRKTAATVGGGGLPARET